MNFNEEVICNYTVTTDVKKLWSIELSCYEQLKRICEKHNIKYFAGGGTLLGAIRHNGFIPWDDDMDFFMLQEDYDKFVEISKHEIQEPFFFQHYSTQAGYGPSMARIRRSDTTGCTKFEFETADDRFNCGIFIDIFPLQYVEDNCIKRLFQKIKVAFYRACIAGFERSRMLQRSRSLRLSDALKSRKLLLWMIISKTKTHKEISELFLSACNGHKSRYVGLISFLGFNKKYIWPVTDWDKTLEFPFEETTISVPEKYDRILRHQYGDYMVYQKGTAIHTMAVFDPEIPYTEKLKKHFEELKLKVD